MMLFLFCRGDADKTAMQIGRDALSLALEALVPASPRPIAERRKPPRAAVR